MDTPHQFVPEHSRLQTTTAIENLNHIPAEPVLSPEARAIIAATLRGPAVWLNAGMGANASKYDSVVLEIDCHPAVAAAREENPAAYLGVKAPATTKALRDLRPGSFLIGSPEATGLPDRSVRALVVDHLEFIVDRDALAEEIGRIMEPGGRVISISYGLPAAGSSLLYQVSQLAECVISDFDGLPVEELSDRSPQRLLTADQRGPSPYVHHNSECEADLGETLSLLDRFAVANSMGESFPDEGEHLGTYVELLEHHWGAADAKANVTCCVAFDAIELA